MSEAKQEGLVESPRCKCGKPTWSIKKDECDECTIDRLTKENEQLKVKQDEDAERIAYLELHEYSERMDKEKAEAELEAMHDCLSKANNNIADRNDTIKQLKAELERLRGLLSATLELVAEAEVKLSELLNK